MQTETSSDMHYVGAIRTYVTRLLLKDPRGGGGGGPWTAPAD